MPIGLFGWLELVLAEDLDGVVAGLADDCGPVRVLEEVLEGVLGVDEVFGVFGKKLSDVSMMGENLIFVCLAFHASLHDSFSTFSSSELWAISSGFLYQSG